MLESVRSHKIKFRLQVQVFDSCNGKTFYAYLERLLIRPPSFSAFDFIELEFIEHQLSVERSVVRNFITHVSAKHHVVGRIERALDRTKEDYRIEIAQFKTARSVQIRFPDNRLEETEVERLADVDVEVMKRSVFFAVAQIGVVRRKQINELRIEYGVFESPYVSR